MGDIDIIISVILWTFALLAMAVVFRTLLSTFSADFEDYPKIIFVTSANFIVAIGLFWYLGVFEAPIKTSEENVAVIVEKKTKEDVDKINDLIVNKNCTISKVTMSNKTLMGSFVDNGYPRVDFTCPGGIIISNTFYPRAVDEVLSTNKTQEQ